MRRSRSKAGRTRGAQVYAVLAIAGVALAGSAAIAANIGILSTADNSEIGSLSAAGDLAPADKQVVDLYLDDPASTTTSPTAQPPDAREFAVDAAGMVSVVKSAMGVRLGDVVANTGWSWNATRTDTASVMVTFTDGTRTLEFGAAVGPDGSITAAVNEAILSTSSARPTRNDNDDEEHEGRDDDD